MNRLILILILTFSFQSLTKAEGIRDFQIEGMSLGDNLLNYFTKNQIINNLANYYNDKEYSVTELNSANLDYFIIQVHYKKEGKKFIIYALDGLFEIENMVPWEREIYLIMLMDHLKEQEQQMQQQSG